MSAGVPVICSNTTALPEIGGNAVLFTDPYQPGQIAEAMKEISTNEALRKDLIAKGDIRKEEFTWDLTADLLWKSIEKAFDELGKPV
jgi:glycosyltransferase involved in cell wall biosynthesis